VEERKEIINRYVSKGIRTRKAAAIAGIARSSYYYKPKGGKKGKRPSSFSYRTDGSIIHNHLIIKKIKELISEDFIDYGYDKVTACLKEDNILINRKKVFRLMKENKLLFKKVRPNNSSKKYVKFTQPYPGFPLQNIEIDIKYIYIAGLRSNAYLITIIDVFSRRALVWDLAYSMKSKRVIKLFNQLIKNYLQPRNLFVSNFKITLRSDNGSQFVAHNVKEYLLENHIDHEFIKPATPQQNSYIESFHSTVQKLVCQKFEFESLKHAKDIFENFYKTYNNKRILKCILYKTPTLFFDLAESHLVSVVYDIKSKKQLFFFRKKQAA